MKVLETVPALPASSSIVFQYNVLVCCCVKRRRNFSNQNSDDYFQQNCVADKKPLFTAEDAAEGIGNLIPRFLLCHFVMVPRRTSASFVSSGVKIFS
jgi:hypothetical protein